MEELKIKELKQGELGVINFLAGAIVLGLILLAVVISGESISGHGYPTEIPTMTYQAVVGTSLRRMATPTLAPTATPTHTPTVTASSTATASPTASIVPSATPYPTYTALPSYTPLATLTSATTPLPSPTEKGMFMRLLPTAKTGDEPLLGLLLGGSSVSFVVAGWLFMAVWHMEPTPTPLPYWRGRVRRILPHERRFRRLAPPVVTVEPSVERVKPVEPVQPMGRRPGFLDRTRPPNAEERAYIRLRYGVLGSISATCRDVYGMKYGSRDSGVYGYVVMALGEGQGRRHD